VAIRVMADRRIRTHMDKQGKEQIVSGFVTLFEE
jgi:hypothetical protein